MSLNRYEQTLFDYWIKEPDERRHWQAKVAATIHQPAGTGDTARRLERELWDYFSERAGHVPQFRNLNADGLRRVSLLNLAEHVLRLWGPLPKAKKKGALDPDGLPPP